MAAISAFGVTQLARFFHFSSETEFNTLRLINYTIPRLCSTYAVATIAKKATFHQVNFMCVILTTLAFFHRGQGEPAWQFAPLEDFASPEIWSKNNRKN